MGSGLGLDAFRWPMRPGVLHRSHRSASPGVATLHRSPGAVAAIVTSGTSNGLSACLDSLIAQSRPFPEIVVVKPDGVAGLAAGPEHGVQVVPTGAAALAANASPFVVFLDANDRLAPEFVARLSGAMDDPDGGLAYSPAGGQHNNSHDRALGAWLRAEVQTVCRDWALVTVVDDQAGPAGQTIAVNFIQVQPYEPAGP